MNLYNPVNPYAQMNYQYNANTNQNNGIQWVQGIEGAKAYQIPPSSNTILMDSENDGTFYIKVSDNVGMCNLRVFKYQEIVNNPTQAVNPDEYVKKADLRTEVEALVNSLLGGNANEQSVSATQSSKVIAR